MFTFAQAFEKTVDTVCPTLAPSYFGLLRILAQGVARRLIQVRGLVSDDLAQVDMQTHRQQTQERQSTRQLPEQRVTIRQAHSGRRANI
ncbi:hypothetical protein D3C78_1243140 [compost metagenome]